MNLVLGLWFLYGRCVGGIEEILEVFLPPSDNIPSRGQQLSTSTVNSVGRELLTPSEAPNGLPEFPRGHPVVLLHCLTELLPDPSFCFRNHPGCSSLGLPVCLSSLRSPPSQPGSIGLLLQLDGIPYFQCPPLCLGIAAANGTRDLTPTAPDGCVNNGGGENGPEKKRVQPLSRSWVPEPRLCVEASPTISSRHRSTSLTSSGSFPPSEVTFHVPKARFFVQAYRPLVRHSKPVLKQVKTWPEGAISALQDCFECTDWDMFREAATNGDTTDLEEHTSSVTSYISKCIDDVTISKSITTRSNQKLWMTAKVCALLKSRDSAFRAGDKNALRTARAKLSRAIREAKCTHSQRIHGHFQSSGDTRCMWQGIQSITNYRPAPPACDSDASLPDVLNSFYAQFEAQNDVMARKTIPPPENQLADVFTDFFNISLSSTVIPTCLKPTTIIPMLKKSPVSCLNDYRPIALTPIIIMKCFERLIMRQIKDLLPPSLDPMQFAYHPNRSTDDAISTTLHLSLTHLENKDTYHLTKKLSLLGINTSLCNWILDFLTGRPQSVRIGNSTSSATTLNTGAPQGCMLSPLLFTLLTHICAAMHSSNHIIKFVNDTTVVGLISKNDESAYREEVQRLTARCKANNLSLNVEKTKEMSTKFGVHLAEDLTWSLNTSSITKKAQQRLHFLRRLRKAHLPPLILTTFYRGTIESILSSCITAWFGNCTILDRKTLHRIVRTAEKIIRVSLPSIMDIYSTHCIRKAISIVDDPTHPSHTLFTLLPSGKMYRSIRAHASRLLNSFFPQAISQCTIPTCFKTTTIVPLPKKSPLTCLNDYRPVALTPIIMKCFERVVLAHIQSSIPDTLDPLQYAYRPNRSTSDAIAAALHIFLSHLEVKDTYIRMLFIDYISAFNTVIPHKVIHKLFALGLHPTLCNWLLSFLTGRPQSVRIGNRTSTTITTKIGTPLGCVLSPILYTLFIHDCIAFHKDNIILKFANDTAVIGRITGGDKAAYRREVASLVTWCEDNNLTRNTDKTK
ncbi:hypothetical protein QTP86_004075 [Hemibagrus guttatus]|nr:hypothetical protein QTP86_004075 [Hemibagrus guttatus]